MFEFPKEYGVVVVGGGHAGIEAALASARMGVDTLLLTMNLDSIGQMSCNPAIGGLGKGHVVREIDAMGGAMGLNTDATGIQFRMLNAGKGPSVQAPRAQCDKKAYQFRLKWVCENQPHLDLQQGTLHDLVVEGDAVRAVDTSLGVRYRCRAAIITTGTFLRGLLHVGLRNQTGGRMGDGSSGFSDTLRRLGFQVERFKTGTPPRLNARSIDFDQLEPQPGDEPPPVFSDRVSMLRGGPDELFTLNRWRDGVFHVEQLPCYLAFSTCHTHDLVRANLHQSPMYCGRIEGVGPRYCPSFEDKVVRFADKPRHQFFLEPEGRHTLEYYLNGCSTSLPYDVQLQLVRSVPGLHRAEIIRPGYAVEYDYCPPTQLLPTLQTRHLQGLFFAGQINGTSGYEEAAGQGLLAGINAAAPLVHKPPLLLLRNQAYLAVMVDDLITKGIQEPYRLFTSRAEYRLLLRQDNAPQRLTPLAHEYGLIDPDQWSHFQKGHALRRDLDDLLAATKQDGKPFAELLKRPDFTPRHLPPDVQARFPATLLAQAEADLKYAGYLARHELELQRLQRSESLALPSTLDYTAIPGLKTEARHRLHAVRPHTLGQAARIPGVNPTDIAILAVHLKRIERRG